jgi:hypothetical protein
VGIRETANWGGITEIHLVDRWVCLGSARSEQEIPHVLGERPAFELGVYKILTHYLKQARIDIIPVAIEMNQLETHNQE